MSDQLPREKAFGWVVHIVWPGEPVEEIKGFATEKEAAEWVAKVSKRLTEEK